MGPVVTIVTGALLVVATYLVGRRDGAARERRQLRPFIDLALPVFRRLRDRGKPVLVMVHRDGAQQWSSQMLELPDLETSTPPRARG